MGEVTLVLVGPHGAGKTTIGRLVAARLGCSFEEEIGARLRREVLARDPGRHAMLSQGAFDEEVFRSELARDQCHPGGSPRVVETWHPGNAAYALERSPEVVERFLPALREASTSARPRVLVQPLRIAHRTALARLTEPGPDAEALVDFFRRVGETAGSLAREWGMTVLPAIETDDRSPEEVAEVVLAAVVGAGGPVASSDARRSTYHAAPSSPVSAASVVVR